MIFIDTSAFLALIDFKDLFNARAKACWADLIVGDETFCTTNYIVTESIALIQNRLGLQAIRILKEDFLPGIEVEWLDEERHNAALETMLVANRRYMSLVDCSSFETMRRLRLETVFTFDEHFKEQGFTVVP
jgi:uncharacterized protein